MQHFTFEPWMIVVGVIVIGAYVWYANLITRRNNVREALSGIDVQLKKRHDLIPNILTIAQKFMDHERGLMEEITKLRTAAVSQNGNKGQDIEQKFAVESQLQSALRGLMVQVENYPALKSDANMLQAQQTYNEVEEHIAAARRFYNSAVSGLLNSKQIFPGNILADMAGIEDYPFYEAELADRTDVNAAGYLK